MNKNENDILIRKFREQLRNYELPVSGEVWERIENDLPFLQNAAKRLPWSRIVAVAALLLLLLGMGWYFAAVKVDVASKNGSPLSGVLHKIKHQTEHYPATKSFDELPNITANAANKFVGHRPLLVQQTPKETQAKETQAPVSVEETEQGSRERQKIVQPDKQFPVEMASQTPVRRADATTHRKSKRPFTFALAYGNQGDSPASKDLQGWYPRTFSEVKTLSSELLPSNLSVTDLQYDRPVAVSLSIRKYFAKRWAYESGLTYTYLKSTETQLFPDGNASVKEFRLHYIGVPLKLVYSVYNNHRLSLYASAGGMIEKCAFGREYSENTEMKKVKVPELQCSLAGNVGLNYRLSNTLGLFVEPGIGYYFDDRSDLQTIRKDKPWNIGVQLGLRLAY